MIRTQTSAFTVVSSSSSSSISSSSSTCFLARFEGRAKRKDRGMKRMSLRETDHWEQHGFDVWVCSLLCLHWRHVFSVALFQERTLSISSRVRNDKELSFSAIIYSLWMCGGNREGSEQKHQNRKVLQMVCAIPSTRPGLVPFTRLIRTRRKRSSQSK